jgi:membrane protein implicated in regulation of membrane protease activity
MLDALFSNDMLLFTLPALLGTAVFLLKLGLMTLAGFDADADVDADVDLDIDVDADMDVEGAHGEATTDAFKILSIHGIAAFMMGFGWGGLLGARTFGWDLPLSVLTGLGIGLAMVWLLGLLLKAAYDLQTSGNIHLRDAVGREGIVYASVPEQGTGRGQVRVVIEDRARIYNATTDGEGLPTNTRVRVTGMSADHSLTVAKL